MRQTDDGFTRDHVAMTCARRVAAMMFGVLADGRVPMQRRALSIVLVLATSPALGQDGGHAILVSAHRRVGDLRPAGLWALPKPPAEPCDYGTEGCCRSDGEPDGGRCEDQARTYAAPIGRLDEPPDASPTPAPTRPAHRPAERPRWPTIAWWAAGCALAVLLARRLARPRQEPSVLPVVDRSAAHTPASDDPTGWLAVVAERALSRQQDTRTAIDRALAAGRARETHLTALRRLIAAYAQCRTADVRAEPNAEGSGWRAHIERGGGSWEHAAERSAWRLGGEAAALAGLRTEVAVPVTIQVSAFAHGARLPLVDPPQVVEQNDESLSVVASIEFTDADDTGSASMPPLADVLAWRAQTGKIPGRSSTS